MKPHPYHIAKPINTHNHDVTLRARYWSKHHHQQPSARALRRAAIRKSVQGAEYCNERLSPWFRIVTGPYE
jgi:hypothetical protein